MLTLFVLSLALLALFCLVVLPLMIVGVVVGAVLFVLGQLLLLPLRLFGLAAGLGAGFVLLFAKLALLFVVAAFACLALLVGFIPLLPVALVGLGLWLLLRPSRRRWDGPIAS